MAGISFDGIAMLSPELQRAFSTAVTAEKKPVQNLVDQKTKVQTRVDLLKDIVGKVDSVKGVLPNLNSPFAIRELTLASTDDKTVSGTADKSRALPGTYSIEVLQLANQASALSNGFEDKDQTRVGSGYFTVTTASGEVKDVFIDNDNATLEGLARSINSARLGLKASVVNDQTDPDAPWRLVIACEGTGTSNDVNFPEFYFVDGEEEFYIEHERPAANGVVRYEGHEISIPSNEVADLIPGATLNLRGITEPGRPAQITISQDIPKTTIKIKDMVERLNQVFSFIQGQNKMDEKTDPTKTIGGEYSIRMAEQRLRTALTQNRLWDAEAKIRSMGDLGIQFQKTGTLGFDEKRFQEALNSNFDDVVSFLTGDGESTGVIPALTRALNSLSGVEGGVLSNHQKMEAGRVTRIDQEIEKKEKNSERKLEDLKMKLARTQTAINSMQRQAGGMGGMQSQGQMVSQLLGS